MELLLPAILCEHPGSPVNTQVPIAILCLPYRRTWASGPNKPPG